MVVIGLPCTAASRVRHERTGRPSTSTVQAPHWPSPQPYLVPVRSSSSRRTARRVVSGSTSTSLGWPLTIKARRAIRRTKLRRGAGDSQGRGLRAAVTGPALGDPDGTSGAVCDRDWDARQRRATNLEDATAVPPARA